MKKTNDPRPSGATPSGRTAPPWRRAVAAAFPHTVPVLTGYLVLGIAYLLLSPKEANYYFGYRCYFGMGSVQAWRFTQKLGGLVLGGLGLVLTVVMLFLSMSLRGMAVEAMVWRAAKCLIWEAVLAILANLAVTGAAFVTFDAKGNYRSKRR